MEIFQFLQYSFIQKAFIAGSFVAIACSSLGLFLVLRKMALIGDGLSHVSFGAIGLGLFLGIYPFYIAIPVVVISSLLILKISQKARVYGDTAIGIVSAVGVASGVILASISRGFNVDLFSYLFGNVLAISTSEVFLSLILSGLVLLTIYYFYWDLFSTTYDEDYAKTTGINIDFINSLLTILTALVVSLSIKIVGVMLVSAFLILPSVSALQISYQFKKAFILSAVFSLVSVIFGIFISFILDLPTGATIVFVNALFFVLTYVLKNSFLKPINI